MDLVVDQVVELEHVHHAHGHLLIERLAGAAVEQDRLAALGETRDAEGVLDRRLRRAVEHGARVVDALDELLRDRADVVVVQLAEPLRELRVPLEDAEDVLANRLRR